MKNANGWPSYSAKFKISRTLLVMINVFGSDISESEIAAVVKCMNSQWVGFGKDVDEFERSFMEYRQANNFLMVDSGSNALYLACHLLGLAPGDEVIIPSFTWVSCAQAVLLCGLKPRFADVDLGTMNINAQTIRDAITPKSKAVMVVHYAGLPCEMDEILELGLPVIEDAAHATAADYKGRACGTLGDFGIFSFDAVKNLTAIEGGGLVCRSHTDASRAKKLRYCGIGKSGFDTAAGSDKMSWWEYEISEAFIKMLPTNIHAVVAIEQLRRMSHLQNRRQEIWDYYNKEFRNHPFITIPAEAENGSTHGLFTYCIRAERRNELAHHLLANGIYTTVRYHPLHHSKLYRQQERELPNCEELNKTALSLPLHPRLKEQEVHRVSEVIHNFYACS